MIMIIIIITYEIVTGGRSSNSGDPGEGRSIFTFLCLVGVSRISLRKKSKD